MSKQLKTNTGASPLGYLMIAGLIAAGAAIVLWGLSVLFSDRSDAMSQFVLSAVLGGGLGAIGLVMLRSQLAQRRQSAWLEQHGTWIAAVPVDVRTIKTDSVGRPESYCLVLEPTDVDRQRHGLDGLNFETDEIFARSVPDNYRNLKIDVVMDPDRPTKVYAVNFTTQDLYSQGG